MRKYILIVCMFMTYQSYSQKEIDGIRAIIGDEIILTSDIENQYQQYIAQGYTNSGNIRCKIIEDLLYQSLLLNQAKVDSVEISDLEIDSELEKRIRYFISQVGSKEELESFYGKSIVEIKSEFRDLISDQLLSQRMQGSITSGVKVTPSEVKKYFFSLSNDSLPIIEAEVEISHIVIEPEISSDEKNRVKDKLISLKERISKGEDFKVLATLYSDDPNSAKNGGELGFVGRGDLVPAFEAAAYKLKKEEISDVIKSEFGYHIIQLIERRGEQINVRHILLKPKISSAQLLEAKIQMEELSKKILENEITFEESVLKYSDDDSKNNEGLIINPNSGSSMFVMKDLDPTLYFVIEKMQKGEISAPIIMQLDNGQKAYRIVKLRKKTIAHTANIVDDYDKIRNVALQQKKQKVINQWLKDKISTTYIQLNFQLEGCDFNNKWTKN